jgi:hypothetical protein
METQKMFITYDKTIHYIGAAIVQHLNRLSVDELLRTKSQIEIDIEILEGLKIEHETLFKRQIELNYINSLLN